MGLVDVRSIANLDLEDVSNILDEYEINNQITVEIAFRLNRRYRELTGQNHNGYVNRILKDYEKMIQGPAFTDTFKKFYTYLKKEIIDGADYIAFIDDDPIFQKKGEVNFMDLSDEEIDHLLRFFNGIPALIWGHVFIPFKEKPMEAVFLNDIYDMRTGHFHPTFVENALDILEPIASHEESYCEAGTYSAFALDVMRQSLRKVKRIKTQKSEGTND